MDYPILFTIGQHRSERSAYILAPKVADELRGRGYDISIIENPEKRSLREIILDSDRLGIRLREKHLERMLLGFDRIHDEGSPAEQWVFSFHGLTHNQTQFEDGDAAEGYLWDFSEYGNDPKCSIAGRVKLMPERGRAERGRVYTIEIPEILETALSPEHLAAAQRVMSLDSDFSQYLLETNLEATKQKGWLGPEIVQVLANGIAYLVRNDINLNE